MKELYQLGDTPPLGEVPPRMLAQVIRQERFGQPMQAFKIEEIATPAELRPDEVLVWVMAAGINYNNVWAGLGSPVDVIKAHQRDQDWPDDSPFHIPQWITTRSPTFRLVTALPTFHTMPDASLPPM